MFCRAYLTSSLSSEMFSQIPTSLSHVLDIFKVLTMGPRCLWSLFLWLTCLQITAVHGGYERVCNLETQLEMPRGRYCSQRLPNLLRTVCGGRYYYLSKRTDDMPNETGVRKRDTSALTRQRPLGEVFINKRDASHFLSQQRWGGHGISQGIVCECCYHQCKWREMRQYCLINKRSVPEKEPSSQTMLENMISRLETATTQPEETTSTTTTTKESATNTKTTQPEDDLTDVNNDIMWRGRPVR